MVSSSDAAQGLRRRVRSDGRLVRIVLDVVVLGLLRDVAVGHVTVVALRPFPQRVDDQQHHADHAGSDAHPGDELIAGDHGGHQGREADDREHERNDQH